MQRRLQRRKENAKQGREGGGKVEDNESEEGKRRRVSRLVAHMEEREDEKETRKTHDDVEEKDLKEKEEAMMAQAHGILLTMDSILSLEGNSCICREGIGKLNAQKLKLKQTKSLPGPSSRTEKLSESEFPRTPLCTSLRN